MNDPTAKAREKATLFTGVNTWIGPLDALPKTALQWPAAPLHRSWSRAGSDAADLKCLAERREGGSTMLTLRWQDREFHCRVPFTDEASIANALTCFT
ncbi:MAG: hypothetical protein MUE88_07950, partial [Flavobacteriales bacterium]|nr:hypothetical protein [Flavobacteriales bacterium]